MRLNKIVEKLNQQGEMRYVPNVSEATILKFESQQRISLPEEFRLWLELVSDGGELFLPAGVQLYGVEHKPVIDPNDDERPNDGYIVIGRLASGDPLLCEQNRERISIFNRYLERVEDDEMFDSFFVFLDQLGIILGVEGPNGVE